MNDKPSCPKCNSKDTCPIFYGYPRDMDWYLKAKKEKKIVGGGCTVTYGDPKWACNVCYHRWG